MNRYAGKYATPELAKAARKAAREKRRREKYEAIQARRYEELLKRERLEDAAAHERELDAPD